MNGFHLIPIGNTGKVCIEEDIGTTPRCLLAGRLDWDSNMRDIREVRALGKGNVVVDAGAYIGDSTQIFLERGAEVYAFEPDPNAFECLKLNCPEAHCYNTALGHGEQYRVQILGGNIGGKWLVTDPHSKNQAVSLDSFHLNRLDLLKVDVEGFELFVLQGARQTILRCRPDLLIEFNPVALGQFGVSVRDLQNYMRELGYYENCREVFRYSDENWDLMCNP